MNRDLNDDKPFVCQVADCGMRFINEDHLHVHSKKHEMSLALNAGGQSSSSPAHHFLDQTPTPTKFLKNCDEISLFQELTQNPFDHAYKKALDNEPPIPAPHSGELNTPTLILSDTLKNANTVSSPLSIEKLKGNDPYKPSPLAKTSTPNKVMLDLSGKSVMVAHSSKVDVARRNLECQNADGANVMSSTMDQTMSVEIAASQVSGTLGSPHLTRQPGLLQHSSSSLPSFQHQLTTGSSLTGSRIQPTDLLKHEIKREETQNTLDSGGGYSNQQQQQCTMQVLLQLPNGETVPISIPATINKFQYLDNASQGVQHPQLSQQHVQPPALHPSPLKIAAASNLSTTMALKQRLKAQLQNQLSPTTKGSEFTMATTNPVAIATSAATPAVVSGQVLVGSTSPIMMVDSPGSEMNLSDSSDYSSDIKRQKMSPESGDPEERRRKFLERNRAAAARCRQKRKHWISNLERKADELQNTNFKLQSEVKLLRGEVAQLKTLLLAHKDCPVTQQQRLQGQLQHIILTDSTLASQDLAAQVVPSSDVISEPLQLTPAIVAFLREPVINHQDELERSNE